MTAYMKAEQLSSQARATSEIAKLFNTKAWHIAAACAHAKAARQHETYGLQSMIRAHDEAMCFHNRASTEVKTCASCGGPLPQIHDPRYPCCAACIRENNRRWLAKNPDALSPNHNERSHHRMIIDPSEAVDALLKVLP